MKKDYIEELKQMVWEADRLCNENERHRFLQEKRPFIKEALQALEKSGDWGRVGMMLRILAEETEQSPAAPFAIRRSRALCLELERHSTSIEKNLVEFNMARARELRRLARSGERIEKYTDRHRHIENAIRLVWNMCDQNDQWPLEAHCPAGEVYRFIAECYLTRAGFALAKGAGVPAKKLEALDKAMLWAGKTGESMDELKTRILLERAQWDENLSTSALGEALKSFIENETLSPSDPLHAAAVNRLHDLIRPPTEGESSSTPLLETLRRFDRELLENPPDKELMTPLHLARAALRAGDADVSDRLEAAAAGLAGCLQTQKIWDETVALLLDAADAPAFSGQWEKAALAAWDACRRAEERIKLTLQLRWYWSRYRDLYDLAVIAALNSGDAARAAAIIDSAKSRPTIKMQDAEKTLEDQDKEFYRLYVESDALFSTDAYATHYERLKKFPGPGKREVRDVNDAPEGWTIVHFYVFDAPGAPRWASSPGGVRFPESCKKPAAALAVAPGMPAAPALLDLGGLWAAFKRWHDDRRTFEIEEAEEALRALCAEAGKALAPVLARISTDNVLFIPHGFLHLIPLHAAFYEGAPLLAKKRCLYLPSWSMAPVKAPPPRPTGPCMLISHWDERDEEFKALLERAGWRDGPRENLGALEAMSEIGDAFAGDGEPPAMLTVYAHGKGDYLNPYHARLVMADGGLTHGRLRARLPDLRGARVMLAACESDLETGAFRMVDEHLSLANAFLSKNASEVLGALFEMRR
ncbi:MAG: hypothetical protein GY859_05015, partial [Desulfobacterales bacterium]|nr:hypothetical protein [Desulfobacterales bacterium]